MSETRTESLTLKWGTFKAWDLAEDGPAMDALKRFANLGMSGSAMMQDMTDDHRKAVCDCIDALNADTVHLDWEGIDVSKDAAKRYVMEYGR